MENPYENYYKEKLLEIYLSNKENIEVNNTEIIIPTSFISPSQAIVEKYISSFPQDLIKEKGHEKINFFADEFCQWLGIEKPKKSLFAKLLNC